MTDIVDKLREIEETKPGADFPRCLIEVGATINNWGEALSAIAKEARIEIELLRDFIKAAATAAGSNVDPRPEPKGEKP